MTGYVFTVESHGAFAPEGRVVMTADQVAAHNGALEAAELAEWANAPDRFAAYVLEAEVGVSHARQPRTLATWRGVALGHVISFKRWRMPQGCRMTSVRVRGSNGAIYSGRYGSDWSDLVRLRKVA